LGVETLSAQPAGRHQANSTDVTNSFRDGYFSYWRGRKKKRAKKTAQKSNEKKSHKICLQEYRCGIGSADGEIEVALLPFWKGPQSCPEVFKLSVLPPNLAKGGSADATYSV
jgi:hypothetical protein